ncbi:unnamed protein product [Acanthoscelides obtectus]|uniref:AP-3 complex subunit beta-1/2 C-terminal domain-containing protein n=1 Tax=Acanthoscelides obtectus TaxID=200917 RepID=A0A9P0Q8E3_ACAOB|nr:unnamed protein product [Acanthoscelides obtectus]CAK1628435.1 hypothetical protein AOBTE_LOCUS5208 [Acanthoscelides obtectus]
MWKQELLQEGYLHEYLKVEMYEDATPNPDMTDLQKKNKLIEVCNLKFAGHTMASSNLTLVTVFKSEKITLTVNCENVIFVSVMLNELISNLSS